MAILGVDDFKSKLVGGGARANMFNVVCNLLDLHAPNEHSCITYFNPKTKQNKNKKQLLGINIFTYILATLIIFFLSMNTIYGVGWLGQSLGWEDVGTFTKVSESLPLDVDVSGDNYLL